MESINFVDIIILLIFLISIIIGFGRGLISEVLSIIILIAAFAVAIYFTTPLANYFTNLEYVKHAVSQSSSTPQPASYIAIAISFALLFIATIIVGAILKALLNLVVTGSVLGIGNRILGGIFGLVRGFLIIVFIIFLVQLSPLSNEQWWQQSKFVPQFQPAIAWLTNIVSPTLSNFKEKFAPAMEKVMTTPTSSPSASSPSAGAPVTSAQPSTMGTNP